METENQGIRIIRKPELFHKVGLSEVTIWRLEQEGSFPKRLWLGKNSVGWINSEVEAWLAEKAAARK